jgi:hypothetical protein
VLNISQSLRPEEWTTLVHVCRGWRYIVFASPRRLNLQLLVKAKTPVRKMLDIWPALPIVISPEIGNADSVEITDNLVAALERPDRVCRIALNNIPFRNSELEIMLATMQDPFPVLRCLSLWWLSTSPLSPDGMAAVIPDSFLGGSAPLLRILMLSGVVFPALPKLLLSPKNLVTLHLWDIPNAGYISPEAMATCLSSLTRLESFSLKFLSPRSRPSRANRRPPQVTRIVLPALTNILFRGVSEYVEDLVVRIDAPRLQTVDITFFNQLFFDISQLHNFINRVERFKIPYQAEVFFIRRSAELNLLFGQRHIKLQISCTKPDWQLSALAQFCSLSLLPISTLEHLRIDDRRPWVKGDVEHDQWLELLFPFTAVKNLYLAETVGLHVATALQELAGESMQVLPALQIVLIKELQQSGLMWEAMESFVAARQRLGHPIVVHRWE